MRLNLSYSVMFSGHIASFRFPSFFYCFLMQSKTLWVRFQPSNGIGVSSEANRSSLDMSDAVQTNILAGFTQPHVQQLLQQTNIFAQHQQVRV